MFDDWDITLTKFGTIYFCNKENYKVTFTLRQIPSNIEIYQGYKVYLPNANHDTFRSLSWTNILNYVNYVNKQVDN